MTHTRDIEKVLYRIVEELSKEKAPIIFKGALALKDLLYMNNPDLLIDRKTTDIDANWIEEYNKDKIISIIDRAVKIVNPDYKVELYREPASHKSLGLKILDKDNSVFAKMDIDIMDNPFYIECTINDINIKYSDFNKMMSDKLFSISNDFVFRRAKDLLDIYLIIKDNKINKEDIEKVLNYENRKLGDFSAMLNGKKELEHAYNTLEGIKNKPDFNIVWNSILDYLTNEKFLDKVLETTDDEIEI